MAHGVIPATKVALGKLKEPCSIFCENLKAPANRQGLFCAFYKKFLLKEISGLYPLTFPHFLFHKYPTSDIQHPASQNQNDITFTILKKEL
jgi:hypothetical protein